MALDIYTKLSNVLGVSQETVVIILLFILVWKVIWYAFALFKAIDKKQKAWFVVLFVGVFVLNDLGLLAIIYLLLYQDKKNKKPVTTTVKPKKKKK